MCKTAGGGGADGENMTLSYMWQGHIAIYVYVMSNKIVEYIHANFV